MNVLFVDSELEDQQESHLQIVSENRAQKMRILEYVTRTFGDGPQPTLETIEYQVMSCDMM